MIMMTWVCTMIMTQTMRRCPMILTQMMFYWGVGVRCLAWALLAAALPSPAVCNFSICNVKLTCASFPGSGGLVRGAAVGAGHANYNMHLFLLRLCWCCSAGPIDITVLLVFSWQSRPTQEKT